MGPSARSTAAVKSLAPLLLLAMFPGKAPAQQVRVVVSSRAGDRLSPKPAVRFQPYGPGAESQFHIEESLTDQTIAGFGGTFLEAGLMCLNSLPPSDQGAVLRALFDPERGAGFSAMKTPLAGTDFMSAGPWYTYDDHPGDVTMRQFSIERDRGPNGLITFIRRARKVGRFVLQAPMDYPPDWMLTTVEDFDRQDVDPKYYPALALYYLRYLQEYAKEGIFIDYLSLFNEPGIYTKISWPEIRTLLRDHVGPLLTRNRVKTRLMASEPNTRARAERNYPVVMDDPAARRFVAVMPYHGYDHSGFDGIRRLHTRYPDVPLWMTELCHAYQAGTPKSMKIPRLDFDDGEFWGEQIFGDLEAGASAWIYWNLILDQGGGPWLVSPAHGNYEDNVEHPLVVIDRERKQVTYTGCYYYLAHFSKYVRPGSVRLETRGAVDGVRVLAFRTPRNTYAAEVMNTRDRTAEVGVAFRGRTIRLMLPAHSITTCLWEAPPEFEAGRSGPYKDHPWD